MKNSIKTIVKEYSKPFLICKFLDLGQFLGYLENFDYFTEIKITLFPAFNAIRIVLLSSSGFELFNIMMNWNNTLIVVSFNDEVKEIKMISNPISRT